MARPKNTDTDTDTLAPGGYAPLTRAKKASKKEEPTTPAEYAPLISEAEEIVRMVEESEALEAAIKQRKEEFAGKIDTSKGSVLVGPLLVVPRESYQDFDPVQIPRMMALDPGVKDHIVEGVTVALRDDHTTIAVLRKHFKKNSPFWILFNVEPFAKFVHGAKAWAQNRNPELRALIGGTIQAPQVRRKTKKKAD